LIALLIQFVVGAFSLKISVHFERFYAQAPNEETNCSPKVVNNCMPEVFEYLKDFTVSMQK